jgi:hypothetical protein
LDATLLYASTSRIPEKGVYSPSWPNYGIIITIIFYNPSWPKRLFIIVICWMALLLNLQEAMMRAVGVDVHNMKEDGRGPDEGEEGEDPPMEDPLFQQPPSRD